MNRRWSYILLGVVLFLACTYVVADKVLESRLRTEICKLVQDEQFYRNCTDIKVDLSLLSGDVRLTNISSIQRTDSSSGSSIAGDMDTLKLSGLSYTDWFLNKKLHFTAADVKFSDAVFHKRTRELKDTTTADKPIGQLVVDRVSIHASKIRVTLPDGMEIRLSDAAISCEDLVISKWSQAAPIQFIWTSMIADLKEGHVSPFMDGELDVDQISIDGKLRTASITGVRAGPISDLEGLAKKVPLERDIISMQIDTISFSGFDAQMFIDPKGVWRHEGMRIAGANFEVVRDKLRPDAPYAVKPLPAVLIRMLPLGSGIDTISFSGLNATYRERNNADRDFARFPFRNIQGTVVNVRNDTTDRGDMTIEATASVFKDTPVGLSLSTNVMDTTNTVKLKGTIGRMAFTDLQATTAALSGVATNEGHISSITMYMTGTEYQAAGRMWMRYDDLKLRVRSKRNKEKKSVVKSALLNLLVKSDRTGDKEGDGWVDYEFDRRRDRSVFNYLWSGVREGAKSCMLPGIVTK